MTVTAPSEEQPTMIPQVCRAHQHNLIVQRLKMGPETTWRAAVVIANILLFQGTTADDRFHKRVAGDFKGNASLVLAEIGCLACFSPELYERVCRVMAKGLSHASAVSRGKIADEGFDMTGGKSG